MKYLKSNMDRFIESLIENNKRKLTDLKSNMDRFIGSFDSTGFSSNREFKIQYG